MSKFGESHCRSFLIYVTNRQNEEHKMTIRCLATAILRFTITHKAPIMTAADEYFSDVSSKFWEKYVRHDISWKSSASSLICFFKNVDKIWKCRLLQILIALKVSAQQKYFEKGLWPGKWNTRVFLTVSKKKRRNAYLNQLTFFQSLRSLYIANNIIYGARWSSLIRVQGVNFIQKMQQM